MNDTFPIDTIAHRHCWFDMEADDETFSCWRDALPGRLLCHKHAGYKTRLLARRAKNRVARASRKVNR